MSETDEIENLENKHKEADNKKAEDAEAAKKKVEAEAEEAARLALYCSDDYVYKISDDELKDGDCFYSSLFGAALHHPQNGLLNQIYKIFHLHYFV
jgi:hypothetical protein